MLCRCIAYSRVLAYRVLCDPLFDEEESCLGAQMALSTILKQKSEISAQFGSSGEAGGPEHRGRGSDGTALVVGFIMLIPDDGGSSRIRNRGEGSNPCRKFNYTVC